MFLNPLVASVILNVFLICALVVYMRAGRMLLNDLKEAAETSERIVKMFGEATKPLQRSHDSYRP